MNTATEPKITVETIDPELAELYLSTNKRNRGVKYARVERYARDMQEGRWKFNAAVIAMDQNEGLIDGQHRLMAIIKSGVPLQTIVVRSLEPDSILTMDGGAIRTAGDQLGMLGFANHGAIATAAYIALRARLNPEFDRPDVQPSTPEVIEFAQQHPELNHSAALGKKCHLVISGGLIAGLHFLFAEKDKEKADEFLDKLATGAMLTEGDPIYTLRERLVREKGAVRKLPRMTIIAYCIKAWNAFRRGQQMSKLIYKTEGQKPEPFPKVE